ncbi:hypothetical protein [Dyadobacter jiangsuensis]|uniref:Uncharacterized protein n=1 Tax=Dyadobacter jiangsuensis TaxID=1591085 RepID=A0A2P8G0E1_9BACT|nr:hypothetical protein [Dyadobacter jiangsuensis]PSL27424.1 hypothetical protein CLV60_108282 [Dyadobacter jiangsuensis]
MLPILEHFPVNWVDGMKIARKHFSDLESYLTDHLRDSIAVGLTPHNYGLLSSNAPDFNLLIIPEQNQMVRVQLFNCRAITGSGCRIEIINEQLSVTTNLASLRDKFNLPKDRELDFLVVLSVNLFKRQPLGQPDPDEHFDRPPYTLPTYGLRIVPAHSQANQTTSDNDIAYPSAEFESGSLIIGKLTFSANTLSEDKSYIPACASVSSHVSLAEWANSMAKLLTEIQGHAFKIVERVCQKRDAPEVSSNVRPLAELIRQWAEDLAGHLDTPLNHLSFTGRQAPPIHLIEAITLATRRLRTTLTCLNHPEASYGTTQMGAEKVLDYFYNWAGITPDTMRDQLAQVVNYKYNHSDIRPQLNTISICWNGIFKIVEELVKLDYIGQDKEDWIIRRRSVVTDKPNIPRENDYVEYNVSRRTQP